MMPHDERCSTSDVSARERSYSVYVAGGMFTLHELATNVAIKEAVWQQSDGVFQLVLPQSKELRDDLNRPDITAFIRNEDLLQVVKADALIARFDGLELDAGTVVEFMMAKSLGKPAVILRSDFRYLSSKDFEAPYNLMLKNWPRSVEAHVESLMDYSGQFASKRKHMEEDDSFERTLQLEHAAIRKGLVKLAQAIVDGLEAAIEIESPYPVEYHEIMYKALRYCLGSGFEKVLTTIELDRIIDRLRKNGTL